MNKRNYLNLALLIIGASILILGAVLFFTVPQEIKDDFREMHSNSYTMENGEWNYRYGRSLFHGSNDLTWKRSHGGIWFLPLVVLVLILVVGIRKSGGSNYFGYRRHDYGENSIEILRRSYADGRMTREEYLDRKNILEEKKEV